MKIVLCSLFALGFFITAIQVIRMFTIANLKSYTDSHAIIMWSVLEVSLGVSHPSMLAVHPMQSKVMLTIALARSS